MQDITDCLSLEAQNVAEARLAAKRAARAEAREIRMKELERQQKEVEERSDRDFGEKGSRPVSSLSAATLASLGGTSSRRGSGDTSISVDTEASIREIKDSLAEVEEKYKRSMVTNAQLDNEKTSLQYQVDTLREVLLELEEELADSRRQYEDKHKECERQKHDQNVLRFQLAEMKEALEQRESLLMKHGIALDSVGTPNGDASLEPHVNADGRPDPPIRATSMGPSEEAVEKKENMSVVGEMPLSKPEDKHEVLLTAPSETALNAEVGDKMKAQSIQKIASNSNDGDTGGFFGVCQTNLEHQEEGLPLNSESKSSDNEIEHECAPENLNKEVLKQTFSEVHTEAAIDQQGTSPPSPVESEIFQDALDNVVQSPGVISQLSEGFTVFVGDFKNKDHNISKQDFNKQEDQVQKTSLECKRDPNSEALEISEFKANAAIITDDKSDLYTDTKDKHETSNPDDSSQYDSKESTADEITTTAVEQEKVCKEKMKPEEQSILDDSGLQCRGDDFEKPESDVKYTSPERELVSAETTIHTDTHDIVEEKKTNLTPEQSPQDIQLTKEETHLVDSENSNYGKVPEPCILITIQSTVKNEALSDSEVLKDSICHLDQHEDTLEARSQNADLDQHEDAIDGRSPNADLDAPGTEILDKGEQDIISDNLVYDKSEKTLEKTNTIFSDAPSTELLDEGKQDNISDHPVCDKNENGKEEPIPVCPDAQVMELSDKGKPETISDHPVCDKIENTNDNVPVVAEPPKETKRIESEIFSSEGESTPEGEESDDNNDNEEDMAVRSEKYTGESLPLGSSVDQTSTDDIRMEDSSDKASRKGKGKNKEDCVVS